MASDSSQKEHGMKCTAVRNRLPEMGIHAEIYIK